MKKHLPHTPMAARPLSQCNAGAKVTPAMLWEAMQTFKNTAEVAEYFGVSRPSLLDWLKKPAYRQLEHEQLVAAFRQTAMQYPKLMPEALDNAAEIMRSSEANEFARINACQFIANTITNAAEKLADTSDVIKDETSDVDVQAELIRLTQHAEKDRAQA